MYPLRVPMPALFAARQTTPHCVPLLVGGPQVTIVDRTNISVDPASCAPWMASPLVVAT